MRSFPSLTIVAGLAVALSNAPIAFGKTVEIDPAKSKVGWTGKKVAGQHNGTVSVKSGQVDLEGDTLKGGEVLIDMSSIKNEDLKDPEFNAKLTGHLKSDDFFGVEQHPTSKFKISSIKALKGKKDATHEISGDLTIKGVTHPVSFPAKIEVKDGTASAKGKLKIDRTKYNVKYGSGKFFENLGDKMINDEFELDLDLKSKI